MNQLFPKDAAARAEFGFCAPIVAMRWSMTNDNTG